MSVLPIPAEIYFSDFSFDLIEYEIVRNNTHLTTAKGLSNFDKKGKYISFLIGLDLQVGDILVTKNYNVVIKSLDYDSYQGKEQIVNAYY